MTTIDFRTMPANIPSLCIPRVFPNIDERRIRCIFDSLNIGEIARVDIIRKKTDRGDNFNRVFIHWKKWNNSENANQSRERLLNGKDIKIIYDEPWFWKISAYRESLQKQPRSLPISQEIPSLQFDSDEDKVSVVKKYHRRSRNDVRSRDNRRPRNDVRSRDNRSLKDSEVITFQPSISNSSYDSMDENPLSINEIPVTETKTDCKDLKISVTETTTGRESPK
jgi:hypothetical protein